MLPPVARGTRLRRPPLATFEPTGTGLLVADSGSGPVVSHCSLDAAYAERPAPDGIHRDPDAARHRARSRLGRARSEQPARA